MIYCKPKAVNEALVSLPNHAKNPPYTFYNICHNILDGIVAYLKKNIEDPENTRFIRSVEISDRAIEQAKWDHWGRQGSSILISVYINGKNTTPAASVYDKLTSIIKKEGLKPIEGTNKYQMESKGSIIICKPSMSVGKNKENIMTLSVFFDCLEDNEKVRNTYKLQKEATISDLPYLEIL